MIKNECEIVKDLIPSYIENLVSEGTKEFVEKHIKTCDSCKDTLENNKKEKEQKEEKEKQKGKFEISYLKKYNKKLEILKTIIFIIAIVLGVVCLATLGNVVKWEIERSQGEKRGKEIGKMLNEAVVSTKNIIKEGNFKLTLVEEGNSHEENTNIYQSAGDKLFKKSIQQGKVITKECLFKEGEKLEGIATDYKEEIDITSATISEVQEYLIWCKAFTYIENDYVRGQTEIKEEKNEGRDIYILSRTEGECYYEMWIDKENKLIIRDKEYIKDKLHLDRKYTWEIREIPDEEIFEGKAVKEVQEKYNKLKQDVEKIKKIIDESNVKLEEFIRNTNYTITKEVEDKNRKSKTISKIKNGKAIIEQIDELTQNKEEIYGNVKVEDNYIEGVNIVDKKISPSKIGYMIACINFFPYHYCYYNEDLLVLSGIKLKEEQYNNKECYVLEFTNQTIWIDKESKLPVKETEQSTENVNKYNTWITEEITITCTYQWEKDNIEGELFDDEMLEKVKEMYNKM